MLSENIKEFQDAQYSFNQSYIGMRPDILKLVPSSVRHVLDIGCSTGILGKQIKSISVDIEIIGIELNSDMARIAEKQIDKVINADIEHIRLSDYLQTSYFDCIICADILEHLRDPWEILKQLTDFLAVDGVVIASIPNIRHYSSLYNIFLKGYWPYRDRGIHDRTHLRFFTKKNIVELFHNAGLNIERMLSNYRVIEKPHKLNNYSRFFAIPVLKEFLTFQYLVVGRKQKMELNQFFVKNSGTDRLRHGSF